MKDRGWAYKPVVFQVLKTPSLEGTIARYGYGISTNSGRGVPATLRRVSDPNATTVAALSPSERDSYYRDLGRPGGLGPSAAPRVGSCEQSVRLKSPPRFDGVPVTPTLLAQLHGLEGRVRIDPRMRKANLAWAECMNQSGYRYVDKRQAYNDFLNRYQQLSPAQSQTGRALRDLQKAEIRVATLDQSCYRKYILPIEEKVRADVSSTYLAKLRSP